MANRSPIYKYLGASDEQIPMGIFNCFIVVPEILAALTFGSLVKNFLHGNLVHAVMAGGVCMLIAAALAHWVKRPEAKSA